MIKAKPNGSGSFNSFNFIYFISNEPLLGMPISSQVHKKHACFITINHSWLALFFTHWRDDFPISAEPKTLWNDPHKSSGCQRAGTTMPVPAVLIFLKSYKNTFPTVTSNIRKSLLWKSSFHYVFVITVFCLMNLRQAVRLWIMNLGALQEHSEPRLPWLCVSIPASQTNPVTPPLCRLCSFLGRWSKS